MRMARKGEMKPIMMDLGIVPASVAGSVSDAAVDGANKNPLSPESGLGGMDSWSVIRAAPIPAD